MEEQRLWSFIISRHTIKVGQTEAAELQFEMNALFRDPGALI